MGYSRGTDVILACLLWHDAKLPLAPVPLAAANEPTLRGTAAHTPGRPVHAGAPSWNARRTHRVTAPSPARALKKLKRRLAAERAAYDVALAAYKKACAAHSAALRTTPHTVVHLAPPTPPAVSAKLAALHARSPPVQSPWAATPPVTDHAGCHYEGNRLSVVTPGMVVPAFYYRVARASSRRSDAGDAHCPLSYKALVRKHGRCTVRYTWRLKEREVACIRRRHDDAEPHQSVAMTCQATVSDAAVEGPVSAV